MKHLKYPLVLIAILLAARSAQAQGRFDIEAYTGTPFGVGRVSFGIDPRAGQADARDVAGIEEANGRVFYPAYASGPLRSLLKQFIPTSGRAEIYFLFTGDQPLNLTLYNPTPLQQVVQPRSDARGRDRLLRAWWKEYSGARLIKSRDEYPQQVNYYLATMLARRMFPNQPAPRFIAAQDELQSALGLLSGSEEMQHGIEQEMMLGDSALGEKADLSLPAATVLSPLQFPKLATEPQIEPIAMSVPPECLYLRFGTFSNYLWFRHRLDAWGGDARNLISERGVDYQLNAKLEKQLGMHETALSRLLGDTVISDVAIIGTDSFMREGAAIGMLFQARSNPLLANDINGQRREQMKQLQGASEKTIKIGDVDVSYISTPDGTMRSYYATKGDFHLVTTSESLARRFLEVGGGKPSLGASEEFKHARAQMPIDKNYSVFAYLSNAFFQNLVSPRNYIEMRRRMQSLGESRLYAMARWTAAAEGQKNGSIADLVAGGYLPANFGQHADGSTLTLVDGQMIDSRRGTPGTYIPVPDVTVEAISKNEERQYRAMTNYYRTEWGEFEPVVAGIRRSDSNRPGLERVTIDAVASPLSPRRLEMIYRYVGPPSTSRLIPVAGDVIAFQVGLRGNNGIPFLNGTADYYLFGGLRDATPTPQGRASLIDLLGNFSGFQGVNGYLGAWPNPGVLRWVSVFDGRSNPDGYAQLRTGVWRRQWDQFTVLSFHPEVLSEVTPRLVFGETPNPSQLWVRAGDLLESKLADFINQKGYSRARSVEQASARFLNSLSEQLHVPREQAPAEAKKLLGGVVNAPLGGEFKLIDQGGRKVWSTTTLETPEAQGAVDYRFPALHWLRKLDLEARAEGTSLVIHADVEMSSEVATKDAIRLEREAAAQRGSKPLPPPVEEVPGPNKLPPPPPAPKAEPPGPRDK